MSDELVQPIVTGHVEYAIRFGEVAQNAPLVETTAIKDVIPCFNPKCIGGGFIIRIGSSGVQMERCMGYVRQSGNVAQFCNYFIRYRVVHQENQNVTSR